MGGRPPPSRVPRHRPRAARHARGPRGRGRGRALLRLRARVRAGAQAGDAGGPWRLLVPHQRRGAPPRRRGAVPPRSQGPPRAQRRRPRSVARAVGHSRHRGASGRGPRRASAGPPRRPFRQPHRADRDPRADARGVPRRGRHRGQPLLPHRQGRHARMGRRLGGGAAGVDPGGGGPPAPRRALQPGFAPRGDRSTAGARRRARRLSPRRRGGSGRPAAQGWLVDAGLPDVLVHLGAAIEQAVPHSSTAVCDRWRAPRFGVVAGSAVDMMLPHPEAPWARALETGEDVLVASADELPVPLAARARGAGFASCWVHPVTVAGEPEPTAPLVIWRPLGGLPTPFTWSAVQRTGQLLRLTLQWDRSHRALEYAATHDTLTGVANRKVFLDRIRDVSKAGAGKSAVLFIDLDHFKPVNDDHGHLAGDKVLVEVADRLAGAVRPGDLVARIGGDEVAVLCERLPRPPA